MKSTYFKDTGPQLTGVTITPTERSALIAARERLGLSHTQLAARLGIKAERLKQVERGRCRPPSASLLRRWRRAVNLTSEVCDG